MKSKSIYRFVIIISLAFLFLSGSIYMIDSLKRFQQPLMILSIVIMFTSVFVLRGKLKVSIKVFAIFSVFFILSVLSAVSHTSIYLLFGSIALYVLYLAVGISTQNYFREYKDFLAIVKRAFFIGHIPLLIISVVSSSFRLYSYRGIFYNANSFGTVAATMLIMHLPSLFPVIQNKSQSRRFTTFFNYVFALLLFLFVIISSSRTNLIAVVTVFLVSIIIYFNKRIRNQTLTYRALLSYIFKAILIILIFLALFFGTGLSSVFDKAILQKFSNKSDDILDERGDKWEIVLEESTLLGHGREYMSDSDLGAHNTFISLLGQYGIFPTSVFILFCIAILINCYKYYKHNVDDKNSVLPFAIALLFFMQSMGEGMMLKATMLIMFSCANVMFAVNDKVSGKSHLIE